MGPFEFVIGKCICCRCITNVAPSRSGGQIASNSIIENKKKWFYKKKSIKK
jgi:hypothetical protein